MVTKPIRVNLSALLWCNNIVSSCLYPHSPQLQGFYTPVMIVYQVYLYEPKELTLQLGGD